jgi:hypothetical protein
MIKKKRELSRKSILSAHWHAQKAAVLLKTLLVEGETEKKLAETVKALRQIANTASPDYGNRAHNQLRGIARNALKRINIDP